MLFSIVVVILAAICFLGGGTYSMAKILLLVLPLFLLLIGLVLGELDFRKLICLPNLFLFVFVLLAGLSVFGSVSLLRSLPSFFVILSVFLFFQIFLMTGGKKNFRWLAAEVYQPAGDISLKDNWY